MASKEAWDLGNTMLAVTPAQLYVTILPCQDGVERLMTTIRTSSTTLTVALSRAELTTWIDVLTDKRDKMTTLDTSAPPLPPAPGLLRPNGRPRRGGGRDA